MDTPALLDQASQLMQHFAAYKAQFPDGDLGDFGQWMSAKFGAKSEPVGQRPDAISYADDHTTLKIELDNRLAQLPYGDAPILAGTGRWHEHKPVEARLGMLFRRMFRHANHYMKKILEPMGLRNVEDFMYLSLATGLDMPSKSELIVAGLSEFTGGIEIINRLIKLGFMTEEPSAVDKRKKILVVTAKGHAILQACYIQFTSLNNLVYRGVTEQEKQLMYNVLAGLDHFHTYLAIEKKHATISELSSIGQVG